MNWLLDAAPSPKMLVLPPAVDDLAEADAAIELWEHYSRKRLDDTQRLTVQVMMAQSAGGMWAAATTGREMPRQNGKGDEIEVVELWGLVQRSEAILHTVHDAVLLASQAQQRMLGVLEGHGDLRRKVKRKWQGTGQQMIEMSNGGVIWYRTRTGGGGRGVDDIDRLVVDEAQHATEEQLAAVSPTLLANKNPQLNAMGTAGLAGRSSWWWRQRKRALSADPGSFGYVGHTAEVVSLDADGRVEQQSVDAFDRSLWVPCNPGLASGRGVGAEFLEEQLRRLGPESFAREHLGVWDPPDDEGDRASVFDMEQWSDLAGIDESARPSPVALAVVASPDRRWASIALAGLRADGSRQVQIVKSGRGTDWVVAELVELSRKWKPVAVAITPDDPAASLLPDMTEARLKVLTVTTREYAQGCGMVVDAISDGTVHHSDQPLLNVSLSSAGKRRSGESWVWAAPADGRTDVSPLKGVTLALYALTVKKRRKSTSTRRAVVI